MQRTHYPLFLVFFLQFIINPVVIFAQSEAVSSGLRTTDSQHSGASTGTYDPVANPAAVVTAGKARFTVLTPQMIRMEWAENRLFEDHASFVFLNRKLPVPKFSQQKGKDGSIKIKTASLELQYVPSPGTNGKFDSNTLSIVFFLNDKSVTWRPGMQDTGNLLGTTHTLDQAVGSKTIEPIEPGLISRNGWTMVDDSLRPLFDSTDFSFAKGEQSVWPWVMLRPPGDRLDWYFFGYGHEYKQALYDYVQVAGRIPLPPKFAFGAWWSRYWAYNDQELEDLVRGFRLNSIPLDVLVIDMDWHPTFRKNLWDKQQDQSGHTLGWSGYSWNKLLFPDPEQFLKWIHNAGLKASLNLHPASGVQPWEDRYAEMARSMQIDPESKKYIPFDITNKQFTVNYFDIVHHPLEKQGIDFWWLDWQQEGRTKLQGVNPTWWLNYVHFTDQQREGKRPLLFHRWGGLGNHRYQIGFSGDTVSTWESLDFQPWFTATAANVGYAYWSHDIGGHLPGVVDPELYTRWIQFGAFSPILRTHTTKNPDSERRIWAYPEPYADIMRQTFRMRYALQPYIYTEARRTYDTGVAFLHPLYYDWPEAEEAYTFKNEYAFGINMLVEPVTKAVNNDSQLAREAVWLPEGDWIEWTTGRRLKGPATVEHQFSIGEIPIYVRAGSIVPMQPDMRYTGEKPVDPLIVNVFPFTGNKRTSYTLYEDSGNTTSYIKNQAAWTDITATQHGSDVIIEIEATRGFVPEIPKERSYEVRLSGDWPPTDVTVNGKPVHWVAEENKVGWRYEGNSLTTVIRTPSVSVRSKTSIRVHRAPSLVMRRGDFNGFAGAMTRLREAYDTLNHGWPLGRAPDSLIDAMQSGDRLSYHPETAEREITHFRSVLQQIATDIRDVGNTANLHATEGAPAKAGAGLKSQQAKDRFAEFDQLVKRALIQVSDAVNAQ